MLFVLGWLTQTFLEYAIHRWLYHGFRLRMHVEHHMHPDATGVEPWQILTASFFVVIFTLGFYESIWGLYFWGMYASFLAYTVIHRIEHEWPRKAKRWMPILYRHHQLHHVDGASNFGVSTTLWDAVFGTKRTG